MKEDNFYNLINKKDFVNISTFICHGFQCGTQGHM